jgi:putative ABC transport system permease protein
MMRLPVLLRSIRNGGVHTAINVVGLTLAMTACIYSYLFIHQEMSFDRFHDHASSIVQVNQINRSRAEAPSGTVSTGFPVGPALLDQIPGIESYARRAYRNVSMRHNNVTSLELLFYVDPQFFDMFSFTAIHGNPRASAENPATVILTETYARKLFDTNNAVGETIQLQIRDELRQYTVGAVVIDPPATSSLEFDILLGMDELFEIVPRSFEEEWTLVYPETYLQLAPTTSIADLKQQLPAFYEQQSFTERFGANVVTFDFVRLTDLHFAQPLPDSLLLASSPIYSFAFLLIAVVIVAMASVNATSLTLGRALRRIHEVGVRKAIGASTTQLRIQALQESVLLTLFCVPVALAAVELGMPAFNQLVGRELALTPDPLLAGLLLILVVLIGTAAGIYPAFVLTRPTPARILRRDTGMGSVGKAMRGLSVVQATLVAVLLIASIVMQRQLSFTLSQHAGIEENAVISIFIPEMELERVDPFAQTVVRELATLPGVVDVASSSNSFGWRWPWFRHTLPDGSTGSFWGNRVDEQFASVFDYEFVAGRNFDPTSPLDMREGVIVNEAFVAAYNLESPIGAQIPGSFGPHHIIGVIKDFPYHSIHAPIDPLVLFMNKEPILAGVDEHAGFRYFYSYLFAKLEPGNVDATLRNLEQKWDELSDGAPFSTVFVDEIIENTYAADQSTKAALRVASWIAMIIAGAGLVGVVSLTVAKRVKEIGIRKVLGASTSQIVRMIVTDFTRLILIGNLIAWPIAFFGLKHWLNGYAYHINLSVWPFVLVLAALVATAWLVIALQSIRTASVNPVKSLRNE